MPAPAGAPGPGSVRYADPDLAGGEGQMIIEYVRYKVPAEEVKAFVAAYDRAQAALAEADQCRAWEMSRGVEDPTKFVIRIEWASLDAHNIDFRTGPHYADYMRPLRRFHEYFVDSEHFKTNEVNARK